MKWPGRSASRPPPRVGKSAGAASGPKTICMTCSRLRIDIGISSVQAISLRIERALHRHGLEHRRHHLGRMGERGDQRQPAHARRVIGGQRQRDGAAERMANHQRPLQPELVDQRGQRVGLRAQVRRGAGRAGGIARAGAIHRNHAEVTRQRRDHAVVEIGQLAGQTVHQQHGWAFPTLHHVQAGAGHLHETAGRRQRRLDLARRAPVNRNSSANGTSSSTAMTRVRKSAGRS